jgi:hypothetical protein
MRCTVAIVVSTIAISNSAQADEHSVSLDKLPKAVTDAVKKLFPEAEMLRASREDEDVEMEYEVIVKESGKQIEISVEADGEIEEMEKEIDLKDLPKRVTETLEKKYPKAVHKSAQAVFEIEDGKEELEFYEMQLKTSDIQKVEVKIKADGTIISKPDEEDGKAEPNK